MQKQVNVKMKPQKLPSFQRRGASLRRGVVAELYLLLDAKMQLTTPSAEAAATPP